MPVYIFQDDRDQSFHEVVMGMKEEHRAFAKDGYELKRIFVNPNAAIDTKNDPLDHKKNLQKIAQSKGTIGNMQDFAAEQSAKREEKLGSDPIKTKMYKKYKETRGKEHPQQRAEKVKKLTKEVMIKLNKKLK